MQALEHTSAIRIFKFNQKNIHCHTCFVSVAQIDLYIPLSFLHHKPRIPHLVCRIRRRFLHDQPFRFFPICECTTPHPIDQREKKTDSNATRHFSSTSHQTPFKYMYKPLTPLLACITTESETEIGYA